MSAAGVAADLTAESDETKLTLSPVEWHYHLMYLFIIVITRGRAGNVVSVSSLFTRGRLRSSARPVGQTARGDHVQ